jgi:hypothetical protein
MWLLAIAGAVVWFLMRNMGNQTGAQSQGGQTSTNGLDNVGQAIANFEGFGIPGSLATRTNNPGNVGTYGRKVANYSDVGDGWTALNNWITSHGAAHPDWSLQQFINQYLTGDPSGQTAGPGQDPQGYGNYVANYLGVDTSTPIGQILSS